MKHSGYCKDSLYKSKVVMFVNYFLANTHLAKRWADAFSFSLIAPSLIPKQYVDLCNHACRLYVLTFAARYLEPALREQKINRKRWLFHDGLKWAHTHTHVRTHLHIYTHKRTAMYQRPLLLLAAKTACWALVFTSPPWIIYSSLVSTLNNHSNPCPCILFYLNIKVIKESLLDNFNMKTQA
jgi:hypothetical protein